MNPVSHETLLRRLRWRYAVKKFDPARKIPPDVWEALEHAMVLAPSSYGLQPWRFFVVTDPALRARLPALSWGQMQVAHASHLVVFAMKKDLGLTEIDRHLARTAEVRGVPIEKLAGFRKMMATTLQPPCGFDINAWATNQVYLALGFFMTAAAMLGVDTCPMEGFEPAKYDELLGLGEQGYASVVLCAVGYRAADDKAAMAPKVRYHKEDVVRYIGS
jgi:nitroreductase